MHLGRAMIAGSLLLMAAPAVAQMTPGQWEMTSTISQMEDPDIPPAIAAMLRKKPITVRQCITPDQAKAGPQAFLKAHKGCQIASYSMAGGKLSSVTKCDMGGRQMTSTFAGTYTPTSFGGTSRQIMTGGGAARTTIVQVAGRLTGSCK